VPYRRFFRRCGARLGRVIVGIVVYDRSKYLGSTRCAGAGLHRDPLVIEFSRFSTGTETSRRVF